MKSFLKITCLYLITMITFGCDKLVNQPFDNRLEPKSVDDYAAIVRNAYPTKYDIFTEILTDDHYIFPKLMQSAWKPLYTPIYLFDDEYAYNLNYASPATSYSHFYYRIYLTNYVIENIESATGSKQKRDVVLAEALLIRSYCYFVLTNLFGLHYNENTSNTDLSIPLIKDVNKENRPVYHRATVKEAYDLIESDLYTAISKYEQATSIVPTNPYQFTMSGAYAFACRLNLYKSNYEKTIEFANKVFNLNGLTLRDMAKDYEQLLAFGYPYYDNYKNDPSNHPNIIMSSQNDYIHHVVGNSWGGFYVDRKLRDKIGETDLRRRYKLNAGTVIDNSIYMRKNNADWSKSRYVMFSTEEVLLSRAEAYLRKKTPQRAEALKDIEALRITRYVPFKNLPSSLSIEQLLEEIMLERRIELLSEGLRWYDVKRLAIPVEHKLDINSSTVDVVLLPDDPRRALQIPTNARIGNPILENQLNKR